MLVITPIWRLDFNLDAEELVKTRDIIKSVCAKYSNISVLDGFDILPSDNSFFADGLHPNSFGASIYGATVCTFSKNTVF